MDYMTEIASHPDIVEALGALTSEWKGARWLLGKPNPGEHPGVGFLRDDFPNAWVAEAIHEFYGEPKFAAAAWNELKSRIDKKSQDAGMALEPPQFIRELIRAESELGVAWLKRVSKKLRPSQLDSTSSHQRALELLSDPAEVKRVAAKTGIPVPFSIVLRSELEQVRQTREYVCGTPEGPRMTSTLRQPVIGETSRQGAPIRQAFREDLMGLAFSGGGIRSATFNLGVLQSLAKIGLLKHCDYLSTVSGGGYIGSWFAGWMYRCSRNQPAPDAIRDMQRRLSPERNANPLAKAVRPIRYLREYSNYLTPRTGFLSADTWTMFGIFSRNALLNQIILISLFAGILLLPRLIVKLFGPIPKASQFAEIGWPIAWIVALCGFATVLLIKNLRRLSPRGSSEREQTTLSMSPAAEPEVPWYATPFWVQVGVVLPWLVAASIAAHAYPSRAALAAPRSIALGIAVGAYIGLLLLLGKASRCWKGNPNELVWSLSLATIFGGATAGTLVWTLAQLVRYLELDTHGFRWHVAALGGPGLLLIFSLTIVVMLGMLGEKFPDEHREWWSRLRSFMHMYAAAWLAWFSVAIYVPLGWHTLRDANLGGWIGWSALGTWVASTIAGISASRTPDTNRGPAADAAPATSWLKNAIQLVAPYLFVAGLVIAVSLVLDAVCHRGASTGSEHYWDYVTRHADESWQLLWIILSCVAVGLLFSWRIDINEFSLHHFYKNRLVRCYLGASHQDRKADWFTGFDPDDDLPLAQFDHESVPTKNGSPAPYPGPYPILNCALNLVGGKDLAWQERKAESFVFTPKYCGYDLDQAVLQKGQQGAADAYLPTLKFYHEQQGPMLGMAVAISGAAANPNMGRATSPASAFLLTAFNVRLGWWIGNTKKPDKAILPGPRLGLAYTVKELTGSTNDESDFVNVSDGGHFDNLGVYELIRRGCRYIIACDSGQDGQFTCGDLGDLVRRCRTDFGVEIDISVERIRDRNQSRWSKVHCVVGKIHYLNVPKRNWNGQLVNSEGRPIARGERPGHEIGYLIYLKPSITGDEPHDVLEYGDQVKAFPHESTADQWFNESQFESYRKLGIHIAETAFARYQYDDRRAFDAGWLFERLYKFWYPPSAAIAEHSTDHTQVYSAIMERVRENKDLRFIDHTLFDGLFEDGALNARDEFYLVNSLLQLMEDVYADLNLEEVWNHPHVEGWMAVFRRWSAQEAFKRTWAISCSTYAERFRNFYDDRLAVSRRDRRALMLPRSFIAAHRGRVNSATGGNTLADFNRAIDAGAEMIELDVRRMKDGTLVVFHDDRAAGALVKSMTYDQIRRLPDESEPVPTLSECLAALRGRVLLDIELKDEDIEADVLTEIRSNAWSPKDFVLTSFDETMPGKVRQLRYDVQVGLLIEGSELPARALKYCDSRDIDFIAPEGDRSCLTDSLLEKLAEAGMPVVPWTVNDQTRMEELLAHPAVAGIITDQLTLAQAVRDRLR